MKHIHKLSKKRKSNKIVTIAKIVIPAAGVIAAKHLWDKKGTDTLDKARSKVLNKTEEVQEKVQKFHDFLQNSINDVNEEMYEDESVVDVEAEILGEENENNTEIVEETEKNNEEIFEETEKRTKESENN